MSKACDTRLSWRERLAVRVHLLYCRGCARLERQLAFLRVASRSLATRAATGGGLSNEARERIRAKLHDH